MCGCPMGNGTDAAGSLGVELVALLVAGSLSGAGVVMLIGMTGLLILWLEDRRIAGHLKAVEQLLRRRAVSGMPRSLQQRRTELLDRLAAYTRRGVYPRNDSDKLLVPVFVDADGRECAVGHLMGGYNHFVGEISGSHNLAKIEAISHPAVGSWQGESGLDLSELALIQPQYTSAASVATGALPGVIVVLAGIVGAWVSHAVRRTRFRLAEATPNLAVMISAVVAAVAGWWLMGESLWAWGLPGLEGGSYFGALRDVAYDVVVGLIWVLGAVGIGFGLATAARYIIPMVTSWKGSLASSGSISLVQRGTSLLTTACLTIIGPVVWAFAVISVTHYLWPRGICGTGRGLRSQWLPLPHRQCILDGQVVAASYADTLFVVIALAPIVWVVARALIRTRSASSLKAASHGNTR